MATAEEQRLIDLQEQITEADVNASVAESYLRGQANLHNITYLESVPKDTPTGREYQHYKQTAISERERQATLKQQYDTLLASASESAKAYAANHPATPQEITRAGISMFGGNYETMTVGSGEHVYQNHQVGQTVSMQKFQSLKDRATQNPQANISELVNIYKGSPLPQENVTINYEATLKARQQGLNVGSAVYNNLPETYQKDWDKEFGKHNKVINLYEGKQPTPASEGVKQTFGGKASSGYDPITGTVTPQNPRKKATSEGNASRLINEQLERNKSINKRQAGTVINSKGEIVENPVFNTDYTVSLTEGAPVIGDQPKQLAVSLSEGAPPVPKQYTQEQVNKLSEKDYAVYKSEFAPYNQYVKEQNQKVKQENIASLKAYQKDVQGLIQKAKEQGATNIRITDSSGAVLKTVPIERAFYDISKYKNKDVFIQPAGTVERQLTGMSQDEKGTITMSYVEGERFKGGEFIPRETVQKTGNVELKQPITDLSRARQGTEETRYQANDPLSLAMRTADTSSRSSNPLVKGSAAVTGGIMAQFAGLVNLSGMGGKAFSKDISGHEALLQESSIPASAPGSFVDTGLFQGGKEAIEKRNPKAFTSRLAEASVKYSGEFLKDPLKVAGQTAGFLVPIVYVPTPGISQLKNVAAKGAKFLKGFKPIIQVKAVPEPLPIPVTKAPEIGSNVLKNKVMQIKQAVKKDQVFPEISTATAAEQPKHILSPETRKTIEDVIKKPKPGATEEVSSYKPTVPMARLPSTGANISRGGKVDIKNLLGADITPVPTGVKLAPFEQLEELHLLGEKSRGLVREAMQKTPRKNPFNLVEEEYGYRPTMPMTRLASTGTNIKRGAKADIESIVGHDTINPIKDVFQRIKQSGLSPVEQEAGITRGARGILGKIREDINEFDAAVKRTTSEKAKPVAADFTYNPKVPMTRLASTKPNIKRGAKVDKALFGKPVNPLKDVFKNMKEPTVQESGTTRGARGIVGKLETAAEDLRVQLRQKIPKKAEPVQEEYGYRPNVPMARLASTKTNIKRGAKVDTKSIIKKDTTNPIKDIYKNVNAPTLESGVTRGPNIEITTKRLDLERQYPKIFEKKAFERSAEDAERKRYLESENAVINPLAYHEKLITEAEKVFGKHSKLSKDDFAGGGNRNGGRGAPKPPPSEGGTTSGRGRLVQVVKTKAETLRTTDPLVRARTRLAEPEPEKKPGGFTSVSVGLGSGKGVAIATGGMAVAPIPLLITAEEQEPVPDLTNGTGANQTLGSGTGVIIEPEIQSTPSILEPASISERRATFAGAIAGTDLAFVEATRVRERAGLIQRVSFESATKQKAAQKPKAALSLEFAQPQAFKQAAKQAQRFAFGSPEPQRAPSLLAQPQSFKTKQLERLQEKERKPPRYPMFIPVPEFEKKTEKKKKEEEKEAIEFIGNAPQENIIGLYPKFDIKYGAKKVSRQSALDITTTRKAAGYTKFVNPRTSSHLEKSKQGILKARPKPKNAWRKF